MKARVLLAHRARRVFLFIHLWIGLIVGLWFGLIGLSGSVLAWRFELQGWELAQRFPLEKPAENAAPIPLSAAIAAMRKAHPDAKPKELATITVPNRKMPFYTFTRGKSRATRQTILVDPYSATVHPPVQTRKLIVGTIQQFHQRLLSGAKGYVFNGFLNFLAVPLLLSGLWLWWPAKWKHLRAHLTVKRGVSLKRTLHDLHNVLGIYLYAVLLLTTLTGAMLVQQHVSADGGLREFLKEEPPATNTGKTEKNKAARPERNESLTPVVASRGQHLSTDELHMQAQRARPHLELTRIELPQHPGQPAELTYAKRIGFTLNETVYLDPYSGQEVEKPAGADDAPARSPLRRWTKVLHLGEYGGVLSKLIYTITGLLPLGLFVTGFWMWLDKKRRRAKRATA